MLDPSNSDRTQANVSMRNGKIEAIEEVLALASEKMKEVEE